MSNRRTRPALEVGDQIIERERNLSIVASPVGSSNRARRGKVVAIESRRASNGRLDTYLAVIWDGRRSPSLHASHRVTKIQSD